MHNMVGPHSLSNSAWKYRNSRLHLVRDREILNYHCISDAQSKYESKPQVSLASLINDKSLLLRSSLIAAQ